MTSLSSKDNKSNKLKELDNDPFGMGAAASSAAGTGGMSLNLGGEDDKMMDNKQAQDRLKELGNRKAISSEDFINYGKESQEIEDRFQAFKTTGATQISSDMMFGANTGGASTGEAYSEPMGGASMQDNAHSYEEYKEAASKVVNKVSEKASEIKSSAMDWFS